MQRRHLIPGHEYAAAQFPTDSVPKRTRVRRVRYVGPDGKRLRFVMVDKPPQRWGTFLSVEQGAEQTIEIQRVLMPWSEYRASRRSQLAVERVNAARRAEQEAAAGALAQRLHDAGLEVEEVTVHSDAPVWKQQQFHTQARVTLTVEQAERLLSSCAADERARR